MRHRNGLSKLNRNSSHRAAMLKNITNSLILYESIKTTLTKAKALRRVVEPIITIAKKDSVANRRLLFARLRQKNIIKKLFSELGPRYKVRPGGYTRIFKMGNRIGDNAPMASIALIQENDIMKK